MKVRPRKSQVASKVSASLCDYLDEFMMAFGSNSASGEASKSVKNCTAYCDQKGDCPG